MDDAEEIREDPKDWAQEEEEDMSAGQKKTARLRRRQQPEYANDLDQVRIKRVVAAYGRKVGGEA